MKVFPLELKKKMDEKYPGAITELKKAPNIPDNVSRTRAKWAISNQDMTILYPISRWDKYSRTYNFEPNTAYEVLDNTFTDDYKIPASFLLNIPFPAIAVSTYPLTFKNPKWPDSLRYTGNAIIWIDENRYLSAAWECESSDEMNWFSVDLNGSDTVADIYDRLGENSLRMAGISTDDIEKIKSAMQIEGFHEACHLDHDIHSRLYTLFGVKKAEIILYRTDVFNLNRRLMEKTIDIILYLACSEADIESAAERLKAGAVSSLGKTDSPHLSRAKHKQILRENSAVDVYDVGYRIAADFKRSYSDSDCTANLETSNGSSKRPYWRRRHPHLFWVGPKKGPLANDIMHPIKGERGLILHWLDAVLVNGDKGTDIPTVIPVNKLPDRE